MTPLAAALLAALVVLVGVAYRVVALDLRMQVPVGAVFVFPFIVLGHSDVAAALALPFRDRLPYVDFPFGHQPLVGWTTALLARLFADPRAVVAAWGVVAATAAAATAYLLARAVAPARVALYWSLAPQLLLFGGLDFDAPAVLAFVAASLAVTAGRPALAGAALALGTATKLFPAVALPPLALGLARASPRAALAALLSFGALLAAVAAPAVLAPHSLLAEAHHPYRGAWNVDSVWLPIAAAASLILDPGTVSRLIVTVSAVGLAATYVALCLVPALRGADARRLPWRAVVALLLWTPVYSLPFSLWALPALALCAPRLGIFALLAAGDAGTFVAFNVLDAGLLGPPWGEAATPFAALLVAGVLLRHGALVLLLLALLGRPDTSQIRKAA